MNSVLRQAQDDRSCDSCSIYFRRNLLVAFLILLSILSTSLTSSAGGLSSELQSIIKSRPHQEEISVIITLSDQADLRQIKEKKKHLRRSRIIRALKEKANVSQHLLKTFLKRRGARKILSLWITNSMAAKISVETLLELTHFPGVESVTLDHVIQAPPLSLGIPAIPEWNLTAVNAPDLWYLGFTGRGAVVANMDTGVDILHPDLGSKWRQGTNSWFNPYSDPANSDKCGNPDHCTLCELSSNIPCDQHGHGTGTMGVMVGGTAGGTAIGVAPDAKWIAAKIFNDPLPPDPPQSMDSVIHQTFQWLLDPDGDPATDDAPDVVNASWGTGIPNLCDRTFQTNIQALQAAGIEVIFAGGNTGPNEWTSESPANNSGPFAVGATDNRNSLAPFSSHGPSACDGGIFPHLVAPGVNIKTFGLTSGGTSPDSFRFVTGTSFAAPHVAGAAALLFGAIPSLSVAEVESALSQSAMDLGPAGPDNDYGNGLLDSFSAYLQAFKSHFEPGIVSLIERFYLDTLGREPETGGLEFWTLEVERLVSLGIDVKTGFQALANLFFNSPECLEKGKTDEAFITDLYQIFLNRLPDPQGFDYWVSLLGQGVTRNMLITEFSRSHEFETLLQELFGLSPSRPENDLVNDFYRGFLSRLPDPAGFHLWLDGMRAAQCTGIQAIRDLSFRIASAFIRSPEYALRGRTDREYVEDLYNGILRRGADAEGFSLWVNALNFLSREQVLEAFTNSPEFQLRIQEVTDASCLP